MSYRLTLLPPVVLRLLSGEDEPRPTRRPSLVCLEPFAPVGRSHLESRSRPQPPPEGRASASYREEVLGRQGNAGEVVHRRLWSPEEVGGGRPGSVATSDRGTRTPPNPRKR